MNVLRILFLSLVSIGVADSSEDFRGKQVTFNTKVITVSASGKQGIGSLNGWPIPNSRGQNASRFEISVKPIPLCPAFDFRDLIDLTDHTQLTLFDYMGMETRGRYMMNLASELKNVNIFCTDLQKKDDIWEIVKEIFDHGVKSIETLNIIFDFGFVLTSYTNSNELSEYKTYIIDSVRGLGFPITKIESNCDS